MTKTIHLYIKTHNITGLKYFGKTVQNPYKYKGSGTYWRRHIETHGNNVTTEVIGSYTNKEDCMKDAIAFSMNNNIAESVEWANLKIESLDGGDTSTTEGYIKALPIIRKHHKSSRWWNNGSDQVFQEIPPDASYISGRLPFNNRGATIGTDKQRGKMWVNNSQTEVMVHANQIPDGYVRGRLGSCFPRRGDAKGTVWWNNGTTEKMSKTQPDSSYTRGRLTK